MRINPEHLAPKTPSTPPAPVAAATPPPPVTLENSGILTPADYAQLLTVYKHQAWKAGSLVFIGQENANKANGFPTDKEAQWNPMEKTALGLSSALADLWEEMTHGKALGMMASLIVETACDWPDLPRVLDEITYTTAQLESDAVRAAQLAFCHWLRCELVARQ